jgi:DNA-binding SARP family transcriptional activator
VYLQLLGTVTLRDEAGADVHRDLTQPKRVALLGYLASLGAGELVRRDIVLALFWPELPERDARRALNQAVHYLRSIVGPDAVVSGGPEGLGVDAAAVQCDVREFDAAIRDGRAADALELYHGQLMEGFNLSGLPEFDEWLTRERTVRARQAADAAWFLARSPATTPSDALRLGDRAYAIFADEGAARRLIALHDRLGDHAGAMRIYEELAKRLAKDYGAKPAPETQALIAGVLRRSQPTPVFSAPSPPQPTVQKTPPAPSPIAATVRRSYRRSMIVATLAIVALVAILLVSRARA